MVFRCSCLQPPQSASAAKEREAWVHTWGTWLRIISGTHTCWWVTKQVLLFRGHICMSVLGSEAVFICRVWRSFWVTNQHHNLSWFLKACFYFVWRSRKVPETEAHWFPVAVRHPMAVETRSGDQLWWFHLSFLCSVLWALAQSLLFRMKLLFIFVFLFWGCFFCFCFPAIQKAWRPSLQKDPIK